MMHSSSHPDRSIGAALGRGLASAAPSFAPGAGRENKSQFSSSLNSQLSGAEPFIRSEANSCLYERVAKGFFVLFCISTAVLALIPIVLYEVFRAQ